MNLIKFCLIKLLNDDKNSIYGLANKHIGLSNHDTPREINNKVPGKFSYEFDCRPIEEFTGKFSKYITLIVMLAKRKVSRSRT